MNTSIDCEKYNGNFRHESAFSEDGENMSNMVYQAIGRSGRGEHDSGRWDEKLHYYIEAFGHPERSGGAVWSGRNRGKKAVTWMVAIELNGVTNGSAYMKWTLRVQKKCKNDAKMSVLYISWMIFSMYGGQEMPYNDVSHMDKSVIR